MMRWRNTPSSFGLVAKAFHWVSGAIVIGMLVLGFYMSELDFGPEMLKLYGLHKSFGVVVLGLTVLRLAWKIYDARPDMLTSKWWEEAAAGVTHALLYFMLVLMPLSGWLMSSAANFPVSVFGLFQLPPLVDKNEELVKIAKLVHWISAYFLTGLLVLHVAAALKHHFFDKDNTLRRMLPFIKISVIFMLVFSPLYAAAQEDMKWEMVPDKSSLRFEATQMGARFEGGFKSFTADIAFDPAHPEEGNVRAEIDLTSVDTGYIERDNNLQAPEWFHTDVAPVAVFQSKRFRALADGSYEVTADLTLRKVTREIVMPFTLDIQTINGQVIAEMAGQVDLNRLDYTLGMGEWAASDVIGHVIPVQIRVYAIQK